MESKRAPSPADWANGLSARDIPALRQQHGINRLPEAKSASLWQIFYRQFLSPFIYVLLAAAIASFALDQQLNGIFILAVLVLNASIGTVQEYSAQRAALALRKMVPQRATVIRDGLQQTIDSEELLPGDHVLLVSGDKVPADLQLQSSQDLQIDESTLTGESVAAEKNALAQVAAEAMLAEKRNIAFAGTIVTHGRGQGVVSAIASDTEIGRIAANVGDADSTKPPLLQRIEDFTLKVSYAVMVVIALLFIITIARGAELSSIFLLGVALAVSAIPEGLPAAITVALAIGMRRMAKANVIVRKLVAVESLGSCTYICSDKTGTLTVNEMTVKQLLLSDGRYFNVDGQGLDGQGDITTAENSASTADCQNAVFELALAGLLANEASLRQEQGEWIANGDGVDLALRVLAMKAGINTAESEQDYPQQAVIPYESENAFSASINHYNGQDHIFVKGSAEKLLTMCSQNILAQPLEQGVIEAQVEQLAGKGFRVLALACGKVEAGQSPEQALHNLRLLGMVAMIDPLRPEVFDAVKSCHGADIQVAMITGDHPQTALSIARDLGLADNKDQAVTGQQLAQARQRGGKHYAELVRSSHVFARVEPEQKMQIVEQLIEDGHFVAVTGDGVNDAPALRHAHVGIAMGKRGTDVARESSDLILTDDNFASIVDGIHEGRVVYNNVRKVIFLLISTGAAEIMLFILSVLFGYPIPLFPIQLLWLNLVTNGIQDVALAFEPAEGNELQQKPRKPNEAIFNRLMLERVFVNALVMGSLAFGVFVYCLNSGMDETSARNLTLLLMVLFENVHVLNSRSEHRSIFKHPFFSNPFLLFGMLAAQGIHIAAMYVPGLSGILSLQPVTLEQWTTLLMIAMSLILVDEVHKWWLSRQACHRH